MITIQKALHWGQLTLDQYSNSPALDTLILLSDILNQTQTFLLAHPETLLNTLQYLQFQHAIQRRTQQEPIAYIRGYCEFWSLTFEVNAHCLIPRPETELLIEKILDHQHLSQHQTILDLGTGSGIIAIILALENPLWSVTATDLCTHALTIAKKNALRLKASVCYKQGYWFEAIEPGTYFNHIVSNPPYLAKNDNHLSSLKYEPELSLVSKDTGLEDLYHLIQQARFYLASNGCLWLEQGYNQSNQVKAAMIECGYTQIQQYKDLSGIVRVTKGCYVPS